MNRKKAFLLLVALQSFLLAIVLVLYISGTIKITTFIASVIAISVIVSGAIIVAFRKLPPM